MERKPAALRTLLPHLLSTREAATISGYQFSVISLNEDTVLSLTSFQGDNIAIDNPTIAGILKCPYPDSFLTCKAHWKTCNQQSVPAADFGQFLNRCDSYQQMNAENSVSVAKSSSCTPVSHDLLDL